MTRATRWAYALLMLMALYGCATDPLPDYRFYHPAAGAEIKAIPAPLLREALQVDPLRADGLYGERPIAYSLADEPQKVSQYHYQLWTDPPGALFQRRMIDALQQYGIASLVTNRASPRAEPAKLTGVIERLERVRDAGVGQFRVVVVLRLRLDQHRGSVPMLQQRYEESRAAGGESISDSVNAMGAAVDAITARFVTDLRALPPAAAAR